MTAATQLMVILAILLVFWFLVMRPARNQQKRVQQLQDALAVGDRVVITAGIFGTIRELDEQRAKLEIAPGTEITVARQVIVRRADETAAAGTPSDTESGSTAEQDGPGDAASTPDDADN